MISIHHLKYKVVKFKLLAFHNQPVSLFVQLTLATNLQFTMATMAVWKKTDMLQMMFRLHAFRIISRPRCLLQQDKIYVFMFQALLILSNLCHPVNAKQTQKES